MSNRYNDPGYDRYMDREEERTGRRYDYDRSRYEREGDYGGSYNEPSRQRSGGFGAGRDYPNYGSRFESSYGRGTGTSTWRGGFSNNPILIRFSDSDLEFNPSEEDIRGRKVIDREGHEVGEISDLFVDDQERKIRLLEVSSGGFLGLGARRFLIPANAVMQVSEDAIVIDRRGGRMTGASGYNPALVDKNQQSYGSSGRYGEGYGWYGGDRATSQYRGRGPRGYRRSDDRIKEDINDRLTDHAYLDAADIEVSVNQGEVTLAGTVESRWAKRTAEEMAESVSGVTDVLNQLRVRQSAQGLSRQGMSPAGQQSEAGMAAATGAGGATTERSKTKTA